MTTSALIIGQAPQAIPLLRELSYVGVWRIQPDLESAFALLSNSQKGLAIHFPEAFLEVSESLFHLGAWSLRLKANSCHLYQALSQNNSWGYSQKPDTSFDRGKTNGHSSY